jgi:alpha/beta superfamily hydrolase
MFLPAKGKTASIEKNHEKAVIFCNPNGGLYELHHFQSDWFKFYTELGCNVFAFNYRGYGRNKGIPSPHANNYDALAIVEYLKTERGITKIAVHGESIGVRS